MVNDDECCSLPQGEVCEKPMGIERYIDPPTEVDETDLRSQVLLIKK